MDTVCDPGVEVVVFLKPTQVGFSEAIRNVLGFWIDVHPGPCLIVMPDDLSTRELIEERIKPLIDESPRLHRHKTGRSDDIKLTGVRLSTMQIYVGSAGSAQRLAARPCRYLICDEVDKYPPFAGREADPIRLAMKRLETYGPNARMIVGSTPTLRDGNIYRWWCTCGDQRMYWVPCPKCGKLQPLTWDGVRWPKGLPSEKHKAAEAVESGNMAWYQCNGCKAKIRDHQKPGMLRCGAWLGNDQTVSQDNRVVGIKRPAKRVGFCLNAIYSPWVSFSKLAAEFMLAQGNLAAMQDFRNSRLAEPFEELVAGSTTGIVRRKASVSPKRGTVGAWAGALFCTADTQKDHFYYTIRAWGHDYKSHGVANGVCQTFDELYRVAFESSFLQDRTNLHLSPQALLIDSGGSRTNEVYEFALRDPGRIQALKGASHYMPSPWRASHQPNGVVLVTIDTGWFKDMLSRLMADPDDTKWLPHNQVDDDYCHQMASEHKVLDRRTNRQMWVKVGSGAANHYWDCEVYQTAAAYMANVALFSPDGPLVGAAGGGGDEGDKENDDGGQDRSGWVTSHKGRY